MTRELLAYVHGATNDELGQLLAAVAMRLRDQGDVNAAGNAALAARTIQAQRMPDRPSGDCPGTAGSWHFPKRRAR